MIVDAVHPAVLVHVPQRSRTERMSLVRMLTPVEVRSEPRNAFEIVGKARTYTHEPPDLHRHEGGIWRKMLGRDHKSLDRDVTPETLRAYLEGDPEAPLDLDIEFMGTPVAAFGRGRILDVTSAARPCPRGDAVDADASRAIRRDDRARAAIAVTDFLGDNVRIAGDAVMVRVVPLMVLADHGMRSDVRPAIAAIRRGLAVRHLLASPGMVDAAYAHGGYDRPTDPGIIARVEAWKAYGIDAEAEAMALRAFLDGAAGIARLTLDGAVSATDPDAPARARFAALRDEVRELELDALTGLCGAENPAAAIGVIVRAMAAACDGFPHTQDWSEQAVLRRNAEGYYAPCATIAMGRDATIDPGDLESLLSMQGGMR